MKEAPKVKDLAVGIGSLMSRGGPIDSHDPKGLATCRLISQVYGAGIIGSFAEVHCTSEGGTIQRQEWRSFGTTDVSAIEAEFLVTLGRQIDAEEWTLTENAVRQALGIISTGISDDCWNNQLSRMFRLYSSDVPGVSRSSISQAAMSVILINGLTTLDSAQGVLISDRFRERERLYALARLDGNKIYWRPGRYEGSSENWIFGSVLHEVLHNVGFTDSQIQTGLFLLPDADNTDNISATLARDCFR